MPGLARGYVTMQTDAGHQPPTTPGDVMDASWASDGEVFDWPALEDFGHRAIHEMTVAGKQVARRYYGRAPKRAYYQGCSTGGRQGLMEAQRYPDDYDGIIAGAPVFDTTVQTSGFLRGRWFGAPEAQLPQALLEVVTSAAVAACDPLDGVADSVITDPRACDWRPDALACGSGAAAESCLTPPQVEAVANAYAGLRLADGRVVAQPAMRGGESGWLFAQGVGDPVVVQPNGAALFLDGFDVDASALSAEALLDRVSASRFAAHYNANDPDLAAFARRGGKLLLFHGWLDSIANPTSTTDLYDAIREETGAKISSEVSEYVRLFMVPGLRHCVGGPGANTADWLTALETWVETGAAPDLMLARHQAAGGYEERDPGEPLERPLCPYPTAPRYVGGDPNAAESFRCE
jgi:feruloyl esterase